jgi:23S rRNA pseudouridine2605 synthase
MQLRLQVILSRAGVASRRAAEHLIEEGKVSVNGKVVTELGSRADPERDVITVSGRKIELNRQNRYILVNKPEGTITSKSDPEGRPTVMNLLPNELQDLHPVGRLDWATEGVLLFTDDGALTFALTHPRFEVRREYHVKLKGKLGEDDAVRWLEGTTLEDGHARAETADILGSTGKHTWLQITLHEGKNREIRRLAEALGYEVMRLRRYSFAGLSIEGVPPGGYRFLDLDEVERLREISKNAGAENIEEKTVGMPPEGVARSGQMVQTKGHRGAFDLTPKGISPTTQTGTTRVEGFDEDGNLLPRPMTPKVEERIGRHGTRTWVSEDAQKQRPPERTWTERFPENREERRDWRSAATDFKSRSEGSGGRTDNRSRGAFEQRSNRPYRADGGGRVGTPQDRPKRSFERRPEARDNRPTERRNTDERGRAFENRGERPRSFERRPENRPNERQGEERGRAFEGRSERPRSFERRPDSRDNRPDNRSRNDNRPGDNRSSRPPERRDNERSESRENKPRDDNRPGSDRPREERPRGAFARRDERPRRDAPPRDNKSPRPKHRGKTRE